jgi:hypothetical protein
MKLIFSHRRLLLVSLFVIVVSAVVPLILFDTSGPPEHQLRIIGSVDSRENSESFTGELYFTEVEEVGDVTVHGVEIQAIGVDGEVLATKEIGTLESSTKREVSVKVRNKSIQKIIIRFEQIDGTDYVAVEGLNRTDTGKMIGYLESPDEYTYG